MGVSQDFTEAVMQNLQAHLAQAIPAMQRKVLAELGKAIAEAPLAGVGKRYSLTECQIDYQRNELIFRVKLL